MEMVSSQSAVAVNENGIKTALVDEVYVELLVNGLATVPLPLQEPAE
jgi:hypothetical protein